MLHTKFIEIGAPVPEKKIFKVFAIHSPGDRLLM